jgi:hypothetical protein
MNAGTRRINAFRRTVERVNMLRGHLRELARHHSGPLAPATRESLLAHQRVAWRDIDAAVAAVQEIQFEARQRGI